MHPNIKEYKSMSNITQKVQSLSLRKFTAFEEAAFDFSPGINVLIGANGTGKTHVMKVIYAILKSCKLMNQDPPLYSDMYFPNFYDIFRLNKITEIIRFGHLPGEAAKIDLIYADTKVEVTIDKDKKEIGNVEPVPGIPSLIYLPSQEFLSINEGFIAAYNKRELAYDETYYNLALALNALPLRKDKLAGIWEPLELLKKIITGGNTESKEVLTQKDGRFHFHLPEGELDVSLVAEGYRKIATLYYLLRNGSLTKESILFWDEPEANLNPRLIADMVKVLLMLASAGMQIFVATHDYLFSHELSLSAEYPSGNTADIRFFALHKQDRTAGVSVEYGQILPEIRHNPILEEFAAHYDRESELFYRSGESL